MRPRRFGRPLAGVALLGAVVLLAGTVATPPAAAAPAPVVARPTAGSGSVTGPVAVPAPAADLAAGDVCAFGVHLEFPVNRQQGYLYENGAGRTVAEYVTGALTVAATRTDTGRTVQRDLSGTGIFTYRQNGSSNLSGFGSALVGFHAGDRPAHRLVVFFPHGFASVDFAADGTRTLLSGRGEDLCRTLA